MFFGWTGAPAPRHIRAMTGFIALFIAWLIGAPLSASTIEAVDASSDRIVVTFSDAPRGASAFTLASPARIALDVDGVAGGGARTTTDGAVVAVRTGSQGGGVTRLVFDLDGPLAIASGTFSADGRTLTLAVRKVSAVAFSAAAGRAPQRFDLPQSAVRYEVTIPVPPPARRLGLPRISGADDTRPLVVIDAGHGGHDPGAISPHDGTREKDLTLAIARAIRDRLVSTGRVRVALTRDTDRFLVLHERYGLARRLGADLFISIHADAAANPAATGASIYTLSEVASDREAARLAARENKADILAGVNLGEQSSEISSILIDLTQRETMNASAQFARLLGREAAPGVPFKPSFHRMASLIVLKAPDMPSILFETGYISNENDTRFLSSSDGRTRIADGVAGAVDVFFARRMASR